MNEEEQESLEILKGLEFDEYDWYVRTDKFEGHANEVVEKVEKAMKTILNLIDKQQEEIKARLEEINSLYKMMSVKDNKIEILKDNLEEERDFNKSLLETLKECVNKDYLHKMILFKDGEIEKLKEAYQVLKDDLEEHRIVYIDTPEFEEKYISKDKIKEIIEKHKKFLSNESSNYDEDDIENRKAIQYALARLSFLLTDILKED